MCADATRIDKAIKLCCAVNPYTHCVGHLCCGGIFCKACTQLHNCRVEGKAKWWIDPNTHLESEPPDYIKRIDQYR